MIRKYIEDYLTFSKSERNAVVGLSIILLLLFALPKFLPQDQIKVEENQLPGFAVENVSGLTERSFDSSSITGVSSSEKPVIRHVYFDPNTLDIEGWVSMGVKEKTAVTIRHYLEKGGRFRKPEDLLKIYGLPEILATELMEYVRIANRVDRSDRYAHQSHSSRFGQKSSSYNFGKPGEYDDGRYGNFRLSSSAGARDYGNNGYRKSNPGDSGKYSGFGRLQENRYSSRKIHSGTVDIAIADTSQLTTLPGIGSKLAARIVSFREKLGGFHSVEQMREIFGIQDSVYQQLKPMLVASLNQLNKININTATEEVLQAHPYIRWQLAKLIVGYRKEHGSFSTSADLRNLQTLDDENLKKLTPYLEF